MHIKSRTNRVQLHNSGSGCDSIEFEILQPSLAIAKSPTTFCRHPPLSMAAPQDACPSAVVRRGAGSKGATSISAANASDSRPFTLSIMEDRFSPVVVDSCELRERAAARVRVMTVAGLRVGLTRRVFAREPLLPSEVEAEEEEQVMRYR